MQISSAHIITLAEKLGNQLRSKNLKFVAVESCTGGGLAYAITQIPEASTWFERGFVVYSNEAKKELLNVTTIETYGAVSEQTAIAMAEGALQNSHAQFAVSITGIAGPKGGTPEKPVGTVWFGYAIKGKTTTVLQEFQGNREEIRIQAIEYALRSSLLLIGEASC
jgi:nicotinamide-nucleotide amidase